jgi:hypothetical protein
MWQPYQTKLLTTVAAVGERMRAYTECFVSDDRLQQMQWLHSFAVAPMVTSFTVAPIDHCTS